MPHWNLELIGVKCKSEKFTVAVANLQNACIKKSPAFLLGENYLWQIKWCTIFFAHGYKCVIRTAHGYPIFVYILALLGKFYF